jgi:hypothetical protein
MHFAKVQCPAWVNQVRKCPTGFGSGVYLDVQTGRRRHTT